MSAPPRSTHAPPAGGVLLALPGAIGVFLQRHLLNQTQQTALSFKMKIKGHTLMPLLHKLGRSTSLRTD